MQSIWKGRASERDWEETFRGWAKPPSQTERDKCANAERAIRKAIAASHVLSRRSIQVFPQGSYCNNTNVRLESDVDICVRCTDVFCFDLEGGLTREGAGIEDATYTYTEFKADVERALVAHFGQRSVTRGNKAFDVHENTYRIDADVVACFEHRRYTGHVVNGQHSYHSGTEFRSDDGGRVINWPHQNHENGIAKNDRTGRRFKGIVKVLKSLACEMVEEGIEAAKPIPSYLCECMVWNVPDEGFNHSMYTDDVRYTLAHLFNETRFEQTCSEWGELNELKYLFRWGQPWTRQQAHAFISAAWDYVGFE
jgi:hypothetical protein